MQTNKKTLILKSLSGMAGTMTFTRSIDGVILVITVYVKGEYKLVIKGAYECEFDVKLPRFTVKLPEFDLDGIGVEVYVDGKLFCRGGKEFFKEDIDEKCSSYETTKSEADTCEKVQKEECITYMDDAVASENYYPSDVKLMCVDGKREAVMLSARINAFIENSDEGLFNCKIRKEKKIAIEQENVTRKEKRSVFTRKPFDYDEVASTIYPMESVVFSRKAYYYEEVRDKIDELFKVGVKEKILEDIMPETQWVRIEYSPSAHYVVGIIGNKRENPDYICYGVESEYSSAPPLCLGNDARWLPLDVRKPQDKGYWLLFQSAKSGETIRND